MIKIRRGTTPTINVSVPMDLTDYTCLLTFGLVKFEKFTVDNSQMTIEVDEGSSVLSFTMTQEQTLSLAAGMTKAQLRVVKDGVALASNIVDVEVEEVIKNEVIEDVY